LYLRVGQGGWSGKKLEFYPSNLGSTPAQVKPQKYKSETT